MTKKGLDIHVVVLALWYSLWFVKLLSHKPVAIQNRGTAKSVTSCKMSTS